MMAVAFTLAIRDINRFVHCINNLCHKDVGAASC
jgi:hypothetical protein